MMATKPIAALREATKVLVEDVAQALTGHAWKARKQALLTQASKLPWENHLDVALMETEADELDKLSQAIRVLVAVHWQDTDSRANSEIGNLGSRLAGLLLRIYHLQPDQAPEIAALAIGHDYFEYYWANRTGSKRSGFQSCFISYSSRDQGFADRIHNDLLDAKVRCWFAPDDMKIGDPIRQRIYESINQQDKLLLVLSQHSLASEWVEDEVEAALEKERQNGGVVLFPITLDDAVWSTDEAWAAKVRHQRHIGDFRQWREHDAYQMAFERLLRDLKTEGG